MENKEVKITEAKIDKEVLDIMKSENVMTALDDDKQARRFILNLFAEFLSEQKKENDLLQEFSRTLTMLSKEKLAEFYSGVKEGFAEEKKRAEVKKIIEKGHKKPKKIAKN